MAALSEGFGVQCGWTWLYAALLGILSPYEGNSAMLAGYLTKRGLIALSQGTECVQY